VQDSGNRTFEHLFLSECQQQYVPPPLTRAVIQVFVPTELYVPPYFRYLFREKPDGYSGAKNEEYLL
jgi:hypothetical protein